MVHKLNGTLDSVSDSTWSYRGDGKAVYQSSSEQKGSVLTTQKLFFNDVGDIDSQGNQLKYRMEYKSGSTAFTNTYTKTYAAFDGYKELTTTVTRPGMTTGVTTHSYTERGELKQVSATGGTSFTRQLANNREGLITSRRENSGKVQNYTYFQGSEVASFGNANAPELANAYAMTWRSDYVA
ncbi:MAG: hypothetical protein U0998_10150, partial [Moraxellaceae bacterium]|nr:hypothetical protein [Moraxellaceae bacterium]